MKDNEKIRFEVLRLKNGQLTIHMDSREILEYSRTFRKSTRKNYKIGAQITVRDPNYELTWLCFAGSTSNPAP